MRLFKYGLKVLQTFFKLRGLYFLEFIKKYIGLLLRRSEVKFYKYHSGWNNLIINLLNVKVIENIHAINLNYTVGDEFKCPLPLFGAKISWILLSPLLEAFFFKTILNLHAICFHCYQKIIKLVINFFKSINFYELLVCHDNFMLFEWGNILTFLLYLLKILIVWNNKNRWYIK